MRLLTGPAGGGKTSIVLERLRAALRANGQSVRLLTPTATMAQHLQNRLAREGFVFRRDLIGTLSGFIDAWAGGARQPSDATFYLIVEEAVRRANRREFARVARLPGFCASLARTIAEFSSAGCDSERLGQYLPGPGDAPLAAAFLAVYREVDRALQQRGLALRAKRLELAAGRIEAEGLGEIRTVWLDGFHALPDPELRVIAALARHADVTLAMADADVTGELRARLATAPLPSRLGTEPRTSESASPLAEERAARPRPAPAMVLFQAPSIEREAEEIARRITAQARAGREFREMGIVVRAAEAYVPVLRSTLARFGIPARFYFDSRLERHAAVRFLSGAVDAMLGGWDHAGALAALRLAPRFADSYVMDRFDFAVREQIPNAGLGGLRALLLDDDGRPHSTGAERLLRKIDRMAAIEEWRSFTLAPKDWAAQMRDLRGLFVPERPAEDLLAGDGHEQALEWRSQAAALDSFEEALDEAAEALDAGRQMKLEEFWPAVKSVLRLKPLRLADGRRNVVHVIGAHEARQWRLPAIFVCGMTEKQFPRIHRQDPFLPDGARLRLRGSGIRVRTAAEFEREERALFESAVTRASMLVTLSYAEIDARGEANLPSLFLEDLALPVESGAGLPAGLLGAPPAGREARPTEIRAPSLLRLLREKTALVSPTSLETYLQCPFQYYAGCTLRLAPPPARPEERLDYMTQGSIVHDALAKWYGQSQDIAPLFESIFARKLEDLRIPPGYHVERLQNAMLEDLIAFAEDGRWPRADFESKTEQSFQFALRAVGIRGRIDRLDTAPDGRAYAIDYKYSAAQRARERLADENLLQAPLYAMAAAKAFGARPAGMFYIGLKGGVVYAGWSDEPVGNLTVQPIPERWLENAEERTLRAVEEIRSGRVEPAPAHPENCHRCDFRDVCRIGAATVLPAIAEGA